MAGVNDNLIPPKKGEVRNPKGKPKGTIHLSTMIRNIADNLNWDKVPVKDSGTLQKKYGKNGWQAIVYVAIGKAISGDDKAREWLSKTAYGTSIDLTSKGESIAPKIISEIKPRVTTEPEATDSS